MTKNKDPFTAERMTKLPTYLIQSMMRTSKEMERSGIALIHFEVGEPDFPTPRHIIEAAYQAMIEGKTQYTVSMGNLDLREAIAERLYADYHIRVDPATEVIVTPGSKHAIYCCVLAMVNPEDEVIIPDPCFPPYEYAILLAGGKAKKIPLREELDFALDPDELEKLITPRTKMILLNSPHNPTGSILTKEVLTEIAGVAQKHNLIVVSDEVYDKLIYDNNEHHCLLGFPGLEDRTVLVNSFSKTYAMTGWRLGYAIGRETIIEKIRKVQEASTTCAASISQAAGVVALKSSQESSEQMGREFDRRRKFLVDRLNGVDGLSCKTPKGAFFAFPNITELGMSSLELSEYLLKECSVVTVPGVGFGDNGKNYIRLSYANSLENIQKGMEQIESGIKNLLKGGRSKR